MLVAPVVRRGHGRDPRDGRGGDARAPGVQRPGRLPDRLGAPPRLLDRDRARVALRAALLRSRGRLAAPDPPPLGRRRRRVRRARDHAAAADPAAGAVPDRGRRRRRRVRHAGAPDRARLRVPLLVLATSARASTRASRRPGMSLAFALPVAMLAYTGLETVANLAQEAREPGKDDAAQPVRRPGRRRGRLGRRSGSSASPPSRPSPGPEIVDHALGHDWLRAPLVGIVSAFEGHAAGLPRRRPAGGDRPERRRHPARGGDDVDLGHRPRRLLARPLSRCCPHAFGTFGRRSTLPPAAILGAAAVSSTLVIVAASVGHEVRFLAQPVQLRRPDHVRDRPGCGRPAALHRSGPRAAVLRPAERPDPGSAGAGRGARRHPARGRALGRSRSRRTRRPGSAGPPGCCSAPSSTSASRIRRGAGLLEHVEAPVPDLVPAGRGRVRADPRAGQARADRRGDARDRDQARRGARRQRSTRCT